MSASRHRDGAAAPAPPGYASIRVVREEPGEPGRPRIALPGDYELESGRNLAVASPGEFYAFIKGQKGTAEGVRIEWPGVPVMAVVHGDRRLPLRPEGDDAVACDVPVRAPSRRAAWGTLEVWTSLDEEALPIRIEHNDPGRRAGRYAEGEWVGAQAKACVNYILACREILRDWGLHREIARARLGRLSLMGFETNNPLHGDWPPHWHLIYYWPAREGFGASEVPGSQVPHFYMDGKGRTVSNSIFVFGRPELGRKAGARDPMLFTDPEGQVLMAIDIRPDGGVDIGPAAGEWTYSIVAGDEEGGHLRQGYGGQLPSVASAEEGGFAGSVRVLRRGKPWIRVAARDDAAGGALTVRVDSLDQDRTAPRGSSAETYRYDPLTGALLGRE